MFFKNDMVVHAALPEAIAGGKPRLAAANDDDGDVFWIGKSHVEGRSFVGQPPPYQKSCQFSAQFPSGLVRSFTGLAA